jgi:hypothetical protein
MTTESPATSFAAWTFSAPLEYEIAQLIQIHEDSRDMEDEEDGPLSRAEAVQQIMQDSDGRDHWASEFKQELRAFGIAVGIFIPKTKGQLDRIVSLGRGKKYDFKQGGTFYVFKSWTPLA